MVRLPCKQKLGLMIKVFYKNYFQASFDLNTTKMLPKAIPLYESHQKIRVSTIDLSLKTKLPNSVRVYKDQIVIEKFSSLVAKFASVWEISDFVNMPFERWMTIPLQNNWQSCVSAIRLRVYLLDNKLKKLVDDTFDELQRQDCLVYT